MLSLADKNCLLIHHWDADGICSAAIIFDHFGKEIDTRIPYIGNYYLTAEEIAEISEQQYDLIIVADMAIPEENILQLKRESGADMGVELSQADRGVAEIDWFVHATVKRFGEFSQDSAFTGSGFADQQSDPVGFYQ